MTVHLIKLAVGIKSMTELSERQSRRLLQSPQPHVRHLTRSTPRRAGELVDGGSIYWVLSRAIRARQVVLGVEPAWRESGQQVCALMLDPEIVPVETTPRRPFQGWRYLESGDAPPDVSSDSAMPEELKEKLRELGIVVEFRRSSALVTSVFKKG